jgi:putative copper export protein
MDWFWGSTVHNTVTLIHILAGVFWLGWMVFMFAFLEPLSKQIVPDHAAQIRARIQQRVRAVVFWLIVVIILTGLYNMGYWGLLEGNRLFTSPLGQRMLVKLGAALVIFTIYFIAPTIIQKIMAKKAKEGEEAISPVLQKVPIILHILAFLGGLTAAYLGLTIGG